MDQEAIKASQAKTAKIAGKENGSPASPLAGKPASKIGLHRQSSLRPVLSATTNQMAAVSIGSPRVSGAKSGDVDMAQEAKMAAMVCSLENKEACLSCGS